MGAIQADRPRLIKNYGTTAARSSNALSKDPLLTFRFVDLFNFPLYRSICHYDGFDGREGH